MTMMMIIIRVWTIIEMMVKTIIAILMIIIMMRLLMSMISSNFSYLSYNHRPIQRVLIENNTHTFKIKIIKRVKSQQIKQKPTVTKHQYIKNPILEQSSTIIKINYHHKKLYTKYSFLIYKIYNPNNNTSKTKPTDFTITNESTNKDYNNCPNND